MAKIRYRKPVQVATHQINFSVRCRFCFNRFWTAADAGKLSTSHVPTTIRSFAVNVAAQIRSRRRRRFPLAQSKVCKMPNTAHHKHCTRLEFSVLCRECRLLGHLNNVSFACARERRCFTVVCLQNIFHFRFQFGSSRFISLFASQY